MRPCHVRKRKRLTTIEYAAGVAGEEGCKSLAKGSGGKLACYLSILYTIVMVMVSSSSSNSSSLGMIFSIGLPGSEEM